MKKLCAAVRDIQFSALVCSCQLRSIRRHMWKFSAALEYVANVLQAGTFTGMRSLRPVPAVAIK